MPRFRDGTVREQFLKWRWRLQARLPHGRGSEILCRAPALRTILAWSLAGASTGAAQILGLGWRPSSGARLEVPYTLEVETPHTPWARPLAGGPIRLLAVPTVDEGRTLVELAQRLALELTTVSIDPYWDLNKYTMSFGSDYGARAESGDLKLIYSYLERELTSKKKFDAILLPINHGWEELTPASRQALSQRVTEGCGLVLMRPFGTELSPLQPVEPPKRTGFYAPTQPRTAEPSGWRRAAGHYITSGVPIDSFPFRYLRHYAYRASPAATVLIESQAGEPVAAVRTYGKGRVVAFGYRNDGLSWQIPLEERGYVAGPEWESRYALLCRAVIFAAQREASAPGAWPLPAPARSSGQIQDLRASPEVIAEGSQVSFHWRAAGVAQVELLDGFGRLIGRTQGAGRATLTAGRPLTRSGFARLRVGQGVERLPVRFTTPRRWEDYEIILPWHGPRSHQPWLPALDEQLRRIGVTTLTSPDRHFNFVAEGQLPGLGIAWYSRDKYEERKRQFLKTGDKRHLVRDVTLQSPAFEAGLRQAIEKSFRPFVPLRPLAYFVADESSLTSYSDAFDVDWSPEALAGFRHWLRQEYPSLEALNASWETRFPRWEAVMPMTAPEARRHGNFSPWADHRAYMEQEFVAAFGRTRDLVRQLDPEARVSISGTQIPTPHNGCNWYEIDQRLDYLQPYSDGNQDAMHYLFRPGLLLTGFTGYGLTGSEVQREQWRRLFYGHAGASIFWQYSLLNPDLTLSPQGQALAEVFGRLQGGIGRVFLNSTVREDGVAVHFSMASLRGAWVLDGRIRPGVVPAEGTSQRFAELMRRRAAWVAELERQGLQFRFLATPQMEAGALARLRVLILPYSIALSDAEIRALDAFMDRGGVVYADEFSGQMTERCRWRPSAAWRSGRRNLVRTSRPVALGLRRALEAGGESLLTVRHFGTSRLLGLLPRQSVRVKLPPSRGVLYDLLRGGPAANPVEASPERPVLLVERQSRIANLAIDSALRFQLTDERGAPVDRSVIRVEVFDPSGRLVRHYSGNVTIVDGKAGFHIPWALNDPTGGWKLRARDVISGLTAERMVR